MAALLGTAESETEVNIVDHQQEFFELFGHPNSIIYDCYTTKESLSLKLKLIMPHMNEGQLNNLINTLWNQKEFTGGKCLFMSPIFAIIVFDHSPTANQPKLSIPSKRFSVHPVFRVQKCMASIPGESSGNCCALFVDETARVYENWHRFQTDNKYEDGLVVAPSNGIYNNGSEDDKVALELFLRKAGITRSLDRGSTVVGLASAGVAVATFIPALAIAPVFAAGAAVAGISCALYTGFRSIYDLYDRKNHKQTINIKDRDARSSWLNVAAGAFSASAVGASQLVATAAQNGNSMSNIARSTIHALNVGALGLNTTGCLDGIHTMIVKMHEGDHISLLEISQLSALLFLLTHSVKNYRTAESVLALSRSCDIVEFKRILTESQKRSFDALVHETILIQGVAQAAGQIVIRSLKNWIDPHPVLLELTDDVEEPDETSTASNSTAEEAKDDEEQEKEDIKKAIAKSEYTHMFDTRVATIVERLLAKFKCRGENELKLLVINLMQELSLKAFDAFMDFAESIVQKYGTMIEAKSKNVLTFEHITILILKQLKIISADSDVTDIKEYIINLSEEERQKVEERIRHYFEHLKEEHVHESQQLLAAHADIADDAKLSIMIEEQVDNLTEKFKSLGSVYTSDDLRETIKDVLLSLSLSASHVFFGIVKKFVQHNGANIQSRLGRYIPLDIFMADIYSMLRKLSANCGQELELYLLDYSEEIFDQIEKDIHEFYDSQLITGNSNKCTNCGGSYYN